MVNFSFSLLACLLIPGVVSRVLQIHRFFPAVFMQLIFGVLLASINLYSHAALNFLSPVFNDSVVLSTLENFGWFGIAIVIAYSSSEVTQHSKTSGDKRFVVISVVGFFCTFLVNLLINYFLIDRYPLLLGSIGNKILFAVTVALGLSVTAVPVLIVMVKSLGIDKKISHVAIGAALLDDLWLWLGLAVAMFYLPSNQSHPVQMAAWLAFFLLVMFAVVKPGLAKLAKYNLNKNQSMLLIVTVIFGSALVSNGIGLHGVFGVFIAGAVLPVRILNTVRPHFEEIANVVFVPLFFVLSGMKIKLDLQDHTFWQLLILFTLIAIMGKFAIVSFVSKRLGFPWRDSLTMGGLMQCKGLMELIVANVLLTAGIISPLMFSILSILAVVSTVITMPFMRVLGIRPV